MSGAYRSTNCFQECSSDPRLRRSSRLTEVSAISMKPYPTDRSSFLGKSRISYYRTGGQRLQEQTRYCTGELVNVELSHGARQEVGSFPSRIRVPIRQKSAR